MQQAVAAQAGVSVATLQAVLANPALNPALATAYSNALTSAVTNAAGGLATIDVANQVNARREYVEDIRMYGFSFNTTIGEASVFGELAYRPNLPVGLSADEMSKLDHVISTRRRVTIAMMTITLVLFGLIALVFTISHLIPSDPVKVIAGDQATAEQIEQCGFQAGDGVDGDAQVEGLQSATAGIAVALHEAAQPEFKEYAQQIVRNAKALAQELLARGIHLARILDEEAETAILGRNVADADHGIGQPHARAHAFFHGFKPLARDLRGIGFKQDVAATSQIEPEIDLRIGQRQHSGVRALQV